MGKQFWTKRGVRQGCPLSPLLFNILMADMEEELGKVKWEKIKLGGRKVLCLAYADDVVLLADKEEELRSILDRLEGYLDRKRLELNVRKTKIMRFRKGGRRLKKKCWRWKGKEIKKVKEFCYLGYTLQRNGRQEAHIRERIRKAAAIMGQVWGIGKRRFGGDWGKRLWVFDKLVWTVLGYGAEIWGWQERKKIESLKERYLRWLFGVKAKTPGYLKRDEIQRKKLRGRARRRASSFERRLVEGGGSELARECWEEMKVRFREGKTGGDWEKERKGFFEERGMGIEEEERRREREEMGYEEVESKNKKLQREERWEKIGESKYNKWYKRVKEEGVPGYLKKSWGEKR